MSLQYFRQDQLLEKFLRGEIDADEQQRFLASCLGDAARMEQVRESVHNRQLTERFLANALSDAEREAYEQLCIADPDLFAELQLLERIKRGFIELEESGQLAEIQPRHNWISTIRLPVYAAAASVLFVAALLFAGFTYRQNVQLREAASYLAVARVPLLALRGAAPTIPQPDPNGLTMLLADPVVTSYGSYRATVVRVTSDASAQLWQRADLVLAYDQQLEIVLPGALLLPGEYELLIEGRADAAFEPISTLPFRVATDR